MTEAPKGGRLVDGVWMPENEKHLVEMITSNKKQRRIVDGQATYQYHKLEACLNHLRGQGVKLAKTDCLDIGGHVGLWAKELVKHFKHVHAFEPLPQMIELFKANLDGVENVTLYENALGDVPGTCTMDFRETDTGNSHVSKFYPLGALPAEATAETHFPVKRLDDFFFADRVSLIKIDVEGFEGPVVFGGEKTILEHKPVIIVEQKGNDRKFFNRPHSEARVFLEGLGMRLLGDKSGDLILGFD